ncbi:uncharacterized [Tachysurus ichikawai]
MVSRHVTLITAALIGGTMVSNGNTPPYYLLDNKIRGDSKSVSTGEQADMSAARVEEEGTSVDAASESSLKRRRESKQVTGRREGLWEKAEKP